MAGFLVVFSESVLFMPHFDLSLDLCVDLEMPAEKGQATQQVLRAILMS